MLIALDGVGHRFGEEPFLFTGISAAFRSGDLVALTGPSGSGKTTLLRILAGWLQPARGKLTTTGIHRVTWVLQSPHGSPRRTALDHVSLPFLAEGMARDKADARARELLDTLAMRHLAARQFRDLSGGEAQRLMLARALASAAELMLVDEPTAQLDRSNARTVVDVLASLGRRAKIVVVATHDPRVVDACPQHLQMVAV